MSSGLRGDRPKRTIVERGKKDEGIDDGGVSREGVFLWTVALFWLLVSTRGPRHKQAMLDEERGSDEKASKVDAMGERGL